VKRCEKYCRAQHPGGHLLPEAEGHDLRKPSPPWHARESSNVDSVARGQRLRLLVLHWDSYPTARAVYREELPCQGHEIVWLERGPLGLSRTIDESSENVRTVLFPFRSPSEDSDRSLQFVRRAVLKRWDRLRSWHRIWTESGRGSFDYIQARDLVSLGFLAWGCARLRRTKFGFQLDFPHPEGHLNRTDGVRGLRVWIKRLEWRSLIVLRDWLMRRADVVFVISENMRDRYLERGVSAERLHVFPVGVGPEFREAAHERESTRKRLNAGDHPIVAYIGSLGAARNIEFFCDILSAVHHQNPDIRFVVLGKDMESTKDRIQRLGLDSTLLHFGTVSHAEVPGILAGADVGIFPIDVHVPRGVYQVSSPLKVAEYMASGLATVTSPLPEARQLVRDADCGAIVEDNTVRDFVEAIDELCRDLQRARKLGENGREYVYSYKSIAELGRLVEAAYYRHLGV
jgi:glycosyltransferase involved in cell wall biosynthesis